MPSHPSSNRWLPAILLLVVGLAAVAAVAVKTVGPTRTDTHHGHRLSASILPPAPRLARPAPARSATVRLRIVPPHRGIARVIVHGPRVREVALTIDDGLCPACAARIIDTLLRTDAHATIFPNGRYARSWDPLATKIRRLLANGQLTIGDHTFNHYDALEESPAAFRADVQADEIWVERTFGVSARPFLRPPYGAYDAQTVAIAGQLGFTKVIMWSGTVADSTPHTIPYILHAIRYWAKPGAIILMHANYPATSIALPQILGILRALRLRPVTLAQLLAA